MRILITGASGSGTTTTGKELASRLHWRFLDADDYFWLPTDPPFKEKRDTFQRLRLILDDLGRHKNAVIAGSVVDWGDVLENSFSLVVFLYLETAIRIARLRKREQRQLGHVDEKFITWASEYDIGPAYGRSLHIHQKWLAKRTCEVLRITGDLSTDERCALITEKISGINPERKEDGE